MDASSQMKTKFKRMKKINLTIEGLMSALLVLLWTYAALVKLIDPELSLSQMRNQVFPNWLAQVLTFAIPLAEPGLVVLLMLPSLRRAGFVLSFTLLGLFTGYIILIKLMVFGRIPCSCGGIISNFTWTQHLFFNLFFLALSFYGWATTKVIKAGQTESHK